MVDVNIVRTGGSFLYDAYRDQYDTNIIQDLSGAPAAAGNKLLVSAADICTYVAGSVANLEMLISIDITDAVFTAKVYNLAGTATIFNQVINWSAAWTATETKYRISVSENMVIFSIEDVIVARFNQQELGNTANTKTILKSPLPIRITNNNADNLLIGTLALF